MIKSSVLLVLLVLFVPGLTQAQTVTSFEGIDASQVPHPQLDIDPNGAVGTKQYMEWVNTYFQAYDKSTFAPVWSAPQPANTPWVSNKMKDCYGFGGDGVILFDRLASRWVIGVHTTGNNGSFYYCVAISSTDDLASSSLKWYTYEFFLNPLLGTNSQGHLYYPDWPKIGTWWDAYYLGFDLLDKDNAFTPIGVEACALDRTNMLLGAAAKPIQCFSDPDPIPVHGTFYLRHSLIPVDVEGTTAPPSGRDAYFVSIQNPPNDKKSTKSSSINLWDFHTDWVNPANSTLTNSSIAVSTFTPGCYDLSLLLDTVCVAEASSKTTHNFIDSVGDRLMPRLAYRNFGTYESFLVTHTIQTGTNGSQQTGIRWYELRGSGAPSLHKSGTLSPGANMFRFMPSIAQDKTANAAAGFSMSGTGSHPGIRAAWWNLQTQTGAKNLLLWQGKGDEENSGRWGDYTSMTVDPVDDCTFWYVNEYFASNQTGSSINWNTRIANFKVSTCQ
jgi:hypothetical protein